MATVIQTTQLVEGGPVSPGLGNGGPPGAKFVPKDGDEKGKVFIGGLSWETTTASMLKYFSRYGEVIDCVVMKNQQTGKSRGFGFVKFRDVACVETVLASGPHILDGRQIDPKACNPRSLNKGSPKSTDAKNKNKIFLGGLPSNCTESQIKDVFNQFGRVECKRAEPRELKELNALQLGGSVFANGMALGPGMTLGPGLMTSPYSALAAQQHQLAAAQGLALLPAGPHLIPLTLPGGGVSMVPASSIGDTEPAGWPPQMAAVSGPGPYLSSSHPGSQLGASQTGLEQVMQQQDGQSQVSGYISASPVPGSTTPVPPEEQTASQKSPYILYTGSQSNHQLDMLKRQMEARERYNKGILGNYPQEASSYGPARGFAQDGAVHSAIQTPYTASVTYAAGPGLALPQAASPYVGGLANGYAGSMPLLAYSGQADASAAYSAAFQAAAAARSTSLTQGFHPYRR